MKAPKKKVKKKKLPGKKSGQAVILSKEGH